MKTENVCSRWIRAESSLGYVSLLVPKIAEGRRYMVLNVSGAL